jgi:alpha-1,3-rhamnosyl/mannosyltransferase
MVVSALADTDGDNRYMLYTDRPSDDLRGLPANFSVRPVTGPNAVLREQVILPLVMQRDSLDIAHFPCNTTPVLFGPPMVVTIHDAIPLHRNDNHATHLSPKQRLLHAYWRAVMPRGTHRARLVVTDSRYALADLRVSLGIPLERMRVVPLAVDPVFTAESFCEPPEGMRAGDRFILAFASPDGRKNHVGAIEAFREIVGEYGDLSLVLVCSHSGVRAHLEHTCHDGVRPVGPISTRDLVWLYRNALALVFPSFGEGFGLPPVEAMACGTPVIASSAGSIPEILGDCAVTVDPRDSGSIARGIRSVLSDPALREDLKSRGLANADRFSRHSMGLALTAAYAEAAGKAD